MTAFMLYCTLNGFLVKEGSIYFRNVNDCLMYEGTSISSESPDP